MVLTVCIAPRSTVHQGVDYGRELPQSLAKPVNGAWRDIDVLLLFSMPDVAGLCLINCSS
jgi:hypothetical protein